MHIVSPFRSLPPTMVPSSKGGHLKSRGINARLQHTIIYKFAAFFRQTHAHLCSSRIGRLPDQAVRLLRVFPPPRRRPLRASLLRQQERSQKVLGSDSGTGCCCCCRCCCNTSVLLGPILFIIIDSSWFLRGVSVGSKSLSADQRPGKRGGVVVRRHCPGGLWGPLQQSHPQVRLHPQVPPQQ